MDMVCDVSTSSIIDALFLFICSILIFQMQLGFGFLEAGTIAAHAVTHVLYKNISDILLGAVAYYVCGYAFSYGTNESRFVGSHGFFLSDVSKCDYFSVFFQYTFAATATTILSGAMAGRSSVYAYVLYSLAITGIVYPVAVYWTWSDIAWLSNTSPNGYKDFAGSGVVHAVGGVAGLVGSIMLGPRKERVRDGKLVTLRPHSVPFATLGAFVLAIGFFAFNVGSLQSIAAPDGSGIAKMGLVMMNTAMAISGGGLSAMILEKFFNGELSLMITLNGMLAGAVAVCAGADDMEVGIVGGVVFLAWSKILPHLGVDDSIDAVPVHLGAGLWGVVAEGLFGRTHGLFYKNGRDDFEHFGWQLLGALMLILWSGAFTLFMFYPLKALGKLRVSEATELRGIDLVEHDEGAYFAEQPVEVKEDAFVSAIRKAKKERGFATQAGFTTMSSQSAYSNAYV